MSKMTIHNLECPHCGNKQETKVWHSVNVKLDPELKRKLFDAQINLFSCEKCGKKTFINAPDLPPIFSPRIMRLSPGLGSLTQPS
jgi:predicted nucleic-acid-binding Zn-ribbon protein